MRIAALVVVLVSAATLSAQTPQTYQPGRTPDGQPDIQGTWINFDATPFEAPVPVAAPAGPAGPNVNPAPEFADHTHRVSKARKAMVIEPAVSPLSRPDLAKEFPLILTNAKFTTFVHSQQRALPSLRKASPEPSADIHPETALRFGVKNKEWMMVESPRGAIKVKARVTTNIIPGVVCCQHGWWQACKELALPSYDPYEISGANPGTLIGTDLADPVSGSLPHRSYLCRVLPAE